MKCDHKLDGTYGIVMQRLLSKTGLEFGLEPNKIKEEISHNYGSKELENESDDTSIYRSLKRNNSNDKYSNSKKFTNTYAKKKGLEKLDCYCEKKIFNNMDKIHKLAKNGNYDKKTFKNIIIKKYGYKIIFSSLFSLIGLIIYNYVRINSMLNGSDCEILASCVSGNRITLTIIMIPIYIILYKINRNVSQDGIFNTINLIQIFFKIRIPFLIECSKDIGTTLMFKKILNYKKTKKITNICMYILKYNRIFP
ncbi:hypothetical protein PVNG_04800 [Plasmodium vivax North Korean]|uniref:Uncharacterized protein n=1 Tax=Plasmodium vivax North Korean TaxID=1035514 RepID=A0A0J9U0D3_PLAVI|nr:hypothetical protein PVNG_04800 [Plasmodium vivax North Korean]